MIRLTKLFILGLLTACTSQTQVHIFTVEIEEPEINQLSNLLEEKGFDVRPNSLPVPTRITRHTVIFPAIVQDFSIVELIESTMDYAGYPDARLILESEANHFFSTNNIGIYLINPNFDYVSENSGVDPYSLGGKDDNRLTYNYFSECPGASEAQSELNLYPSGTAILEEFVWAEDTRQEVSYIHDGDWLADSSSVKIDIFGKGELRFSIEEHSGTNWFGPYEGITLVNQHSTMDIERCNYTHLKYKE